MSSAPFFSIVIPTYNRADLVGITLESVLAQEFADFEVIVVDDGSTDNTAEVVGKISDARIRYFKRPNAERGASRNFGAGVARGSYVNFFDSDDLMYPNHLAVARERIEAWGSPEFFHLGYDFKSPEGAVTRRVNNFEKTVATTILYDNVLSCNGVFVRRDVCVTHPFVEDRRLASAEDWELWIRLISRFTLHFSNEITSSVVSHDQRSILTINSDKVIDRDLFLIEKLEGDPFVTNLYGAEFRRFKANRYTYIMLCLAGEKRRREVARWAIRAFLEYPAILFSARYLASIKKIIIP